MDDYIRRSDALELICSECVRDSATSKHCGVSCYEYEKMKMLPAADVRPVVRGKWIQTTQSMGWEDGECAECSVCGEDFVLDEWSMDDFINTMNFCSNCETDMRGERDV